MSYPSHASAYMLWSTLLYEDSASSWSSCGIWTYKSEKSAHWSPAKGQDKQAFTRETNLVYSEQMKNMGQQMNQNITFASFRTNWIPCPGYTVDEQNQHFSNLILSNFLQTNRNIKGKQKSQIKTPSKFNPGWLGFCLSLLISIWIRWKKTLS